MTDNKGLGQNQKFGPVSRFVQWSIRFYQNNISPMLGANCKFIPTCSQYALEAVQIHGVVVGMLLAVWRILRCNPFSKGGYDPVPPKNKADRV